MLITKADYKGKLLSVNIQNYSVSYNLEKIEDSLTLTDKSHPDFSSWYLIKQH